MLKESKKKKIA